MIIGAGRLVRDRNVEKGSGESVLSGGCEHKVAMTSASSVIGLYDSDGVSRIPLIARRLVVLKRAMIIVDSSVAEQSMVSAHSRWFQHSV